ncbi:MAG TPA: iron donor protein CyaY [Alphaproteobacteria bacterium]|nr:iron donor protein CyaY [Alphaproteobacteria bacterium]
MNQVEFERLAGQVLEGLFEQIESQLGDCLDVDLEGGILTIELSDGATYIVNKHAPNRELWLSSPKSGAWHFARGEAGWRSTRPGPNGPLGFPAVLAEELAAACGRAVALSA